MAKALTVLALLLAGCSTVPAEPWTISNPADKTGWERRRYCSHDQLMCLGPNGLSVAVWRKF